MSSNTVDGSKIERQRQIVREWNYKRRLEQAKRKKLRTTRLVVNAKKLINHFIKYQKYGLLNIELIKNIKIIEQE